MDRYRGFSYEDLEGTYVPTYSGSSQDEKMTICMVTEILITCKYGWLLIGLPDYSTYYSVDVCV